MQPRKILFILGTRPEAIKLCPLIVWLKRFPECYAVRICVTAQHRQMLDQVLSAFAVCPDHDLDLMLPGQTLLASTARILAGLESVFAREKPGLVIVQGDTTTTFCGSLAAFYAHVPVAHVEAGLRTGDLQQPFPEELNRVLTTRLATLHFAPSQNAAQNLLREGVPGAHIAITGNTGIDALLYVEQQLLTGGYEDVLKLNLPLNKKVILVTAHRRESFGAGFERICQALQQLARRDDVFIIFPVHPNPNVRIPVNRYLAAHAGISLIEPLDYVAFVDLMRRSYLLVTDSGGIQEEAPSLGKPVLVLRERTERSEAVMAGTVKLVGTKVSKIVSETNALLDCEQMYARMARKQNPYGRGDACQRIEHALRHFFHFDGHMTGITPPPVSCMANHPA